MKLTLKALKLAGIVVSGGYLVFWSYVLLQNREESREFKTGLIKLIAADTVVFALLARRKSSRKKEEESKLPNLQAARQK